MAKNVNTVIMKERVFYVSEKKRKIVYILLCIYCSPSLDTFLRFIELITSVIVPVVFRIPNSY